MKKDILKTFLLWPLSACGIPKGKQIVNNDVGNDGIRKMFLTISSVDFFTLTINAGDVEMCKH